jgi:hypothetical protein
MVGALAAAVIAGAQEPTQTEQVPGTSTGRLVTSPARQLASVAPGGKTSFPMIVQNRLGRTATIEVGTFDLAPGADTYSRLVKAGSEGRGAGEWLAPEAGTFVLRDGERKTFDVAIAVPSAAGPGGHFGAVTIEVKPEQDDDERIGVGVRIATNVTVLVPGAVTYDGRVRDVRLQARGRGKVRVEFDAAITGNIQSRPTATIRLDGPFGHSKRRTIELPEILPGGDRHIVEDLPRPGLVGRTRASVELTFEDRSTTKRVSSGHLTLLPPRRLVAGVLAGLVVAVLVLAGFRRRRTRLLLERYGDDAEDDDPYDEELSDDPS